MRFLLVHGGWQGGWCWNGVVAELRARGHTAFAPTLPGCGPEDGDRAAAGLSSGADAVVRLVVERDLTDLVLVGHSGGGPVVQVVAERMPERVTRLVFVDAWVLDHGESINQVLAPETVEMFRATAAASPDGCIPMPEDLWEKGLCGDLPAHEARRYLDRVVPASPAWLDEPAPLPARAWAGVPSGYVFLEDDRTVDPALYARMAARLDRPRTTSCPGAHEAMLSRPVELTDALVRVTA